MVEQQRPDVVILDVGMPLQNGYDVARKIPRGGFDMHLVKPVEPEVLLNPIQQWAKTRDLK